jgi:hypothetical protein
MKEIVIVLQVTDLLQTLESSTSEGPPLLSSDQSSWLQIQRSRCDSRRHQIFWEVVGLEQGPLSFVSTTEELLWKKKK